MKTENFPISISSSTPKAILVLLLAVILGTVFLYFFTETFVPEPGVSRITKTIFEEDIAELENDIGKPCTEIHDQAEIFAREEIKSFIQQGLAGKDWIKVITIEQKEFIDRYRDWLSECERGVALAKKIGRDWPKFSDLDDLYSTLAILSTSYGKHPASAKNLKPGALESLQRVYREYENTHL